MDWRHRPERCGALDAHRLTLASGDSVLVSDWGAQVLSWRCQGREQLYLSPNAVLDGVTAVRGGVPICWPQFANRGPGRKHGWARQSLWASEPPQTEGGGVRQRWRLCAEALDESRRPWPYQLCYDVTLQTGQLRLALEVHNTGSELLRFTGALHTYLAIDDSHRARLSGWQATEGWDALTGAPSATPQHGRVDGPVDRIDPCPGTLSLVDGRRMRQIEQGGFADTVVWNPGPDAGLPDMPAGDERRMVCVEAAQALVPVALAPGERWVGWQRLTCA